MSDDRAMPSNARFRFVGAGLWDGGDDFPYDVPVQRIPCVGELVAMPDESPRWRVVEVVFDYAQGLNYEPLARVVCEPIDSASDDKL